MKHTLIIFFALIIALTVNAQGISVASFKMLPNDLTANTNGTEVLDQNGDKAALIKVVTTQTGFTFEGGALGICATKQKIGEIWVYVPQKSKKITVLHQNLGVLRDYYFPCAIEAARTYEMQLASGSVHTVITHDVTQQYVLFKVVPPDAAVELDGHMLRTVDGTATKRLPFGTYTYKVQAPDYYAESGQVIVNNPNNRHIVNVNLKPAFSHITLKASSPDVEIWIDNEKKGVGIWAGTLGYGSYSIESRRENYHTAIQEITISKENENSTITLGSPTAITGSLDINSEPADAEVYIDGKNIGNTPLFVKDYVIGNHDLIISKKGYNDFKTKLTLKEGCTNTVNPSLDEKTKELTFNVLGVTLSMIPIDGGSFVMGATSEQGRDANKDEKPAHTVSLSSYYIGKYEVTQALWKAVMGENIPSISKDSLQCGYGDEYPMYHVTWDECISFIKELNSITGKNFRLPTEAEWEFACRGGNNSKGYKYSGSNDIADVAWIISNSDFFTHPVGEKHPNEIGIYDMSGNVSEICSDWWENYSNESQMNPIGPIDGYSHIQRGGAWNNDAWKCRSSCRIIKSADERLNNCGFRLALSEN